ncbi:MAG: hypothetical protein BJ554DRAFT_4864, partial [Olpidium bornovanus]
LVRKTSDHGAVVVRARVERAAEQFRPLPRQGPGEVLVGCRRRRLLPGQGSRASALLLALVAAPRRQHPPLLQDVDVGLLRLHVQRLQDLGAARGPAGRGSEHRVPQPDVVRRPSETVDRSPNQRRRDGPGHGRAFPDGRTLTTSGPCVPEIANSAESKMSS